MNDYLKILDDSRRSVYNHKLPSENALMLHSVEKNGPAHKADLHPGDIIIGFNTTTITCMDDLQKQLTEEQLEKEAILTILRNGRKITIKIIPEEYIPN